MCFPIEFARQSGDFNFISPIINFTGNAAVVAVCGVGISAISILALKLLGFGTAATVATAAVPLTIAVAATVLTGIGLYGVFLGVKALCW